MAQVARWAGRIVAHQASCRRPPLAISWPSSRLCRSVHWPCRRSCRAPVRSAACRVAASSTMLRASRPYRGACSAVSQHCIARHPAARPSFCPDKNDCIVTHPTNQVARALQHALARGRPCRGPFWLCHGVVSQPAGRVVAWPPLSEPSYTVSRYKNCIVTQTGKRGSRPFQLPAPLFFLFSFSCFSTYWKTIKNILYFFSNRKK